MPYLLTIVHPYDFDDEGTRRAGVSIDHHATHTLDEAERGCWDHLHNGLGAAQPQDAVPGRITAKGGAMGPTRTGLTVVVTPMPYDTMACALEHPEPTTDAECHALVTAYHDRAKERRYA